MWSEQDCSKLKTLSCAINTHFMMHESVLPSRHRHRHRHGLRLWGLFNVATENALYFGVYWTSQTPGVLVCWHCSIMFLFMMWTSSSHLTLNFWWPRVGGVSCSSLFISLNSQLLITKGGWGGGVVSCCSLLISLNSKLLMIKGGWGGAGCHPPHCSSHKPSWLQLSNEMKLISIAVCQHSLS